MASMFLGTYTPKLDDKGRLFLPAKFRERMAGGLVVTRSQDRALSIYPIDEFTKIAENLQMAPSTDRRARDYVRVMLSGASDEIPDKQGRFTIPLPLREYAGLTREVTVIGAGSKLELWDSAAWATYLADTEQSFSDTDEEVIPGLI